MKEFFHSRSFKILLAAMLLLLGVILYTASIGGFAPLTSSIVGGITTPLQDLTAQGTEAADELLNTVTDDPVSYTHLDVYKRQPLTIRIS